MLTEREQINVQDWLDENLEATFEDTSFSHEFGTQVQGGFIAVVPKECPYALEEISYMVKDSDYVYSFVNGVDDDEVINLYYNDNGYFEEL